MGIAIVGISGLGHRVLFARSASTFGRVRAPQSSHSGNKFANTDNPGEFSFRLRTLLMNSFRALLLI
jgi:hypothetical protein